MANERKLKKTSRWRGYTRQEKIILTIFTFFLLLYLVWAFFPTFFALMNAFKPETEYYDSVLALPKAWKFSNFTKSLSIMKYRNKNALQMFGNSFIFASTFSLSNVTAFVLTGYTMSRFKFRGRKFLLGVTTLIMIFPIFGTMTAGYVLIADVLHIDNNFFLLWIIMFNGFSSATLVTMTFFQTIAGTYADAACIDGAGNFTVFLRIMLPIASPIIFTMLIQHFIGFWNDYLTPMIYLSKQPTLANGLFALRQSAPYIGGTTLYLAAAFIGLLVPVVLFAAAQKRIIGASFEGGIKG